MNKRKSVFRILALLLTMFLFFEDAGYTFAREGTDMVERLSREADERAEQERLEKEQQKLYDTYFGSQGAVTVSGNEELFEKEQKQSMQASEKKETGRDEAWAPAEKAADLLRAPVTETEEEPGELIATGTYDKTYQTGKDRYKTVFTTYPNTFEKNGETLLIDNTLVPEKSVSGNTVYTNALSGIDTAIEGNEKSGQVSLCTEEGAVRLLAEEGSFEKESVSENAIRYNGVFENVDIQYTVTNTGVKEDIILLSPGTKKSFTYRLDREGIRAEEKNGSIVIYRVDDSISGNGISDRSVSGNGISDRSISGNSVSENRISDRTPFAVISAPRMKDAAGAQSDQISLALKDEGDFYAITLTPDTAWITDEERVYPVTIDPTTTLQPEITTYTVTSTNEFFENSVSDYVGYCGDQYGTARTYLITNFLYQSIFDTAGTDKVEITAANLRIYQNNDSTDSSIGCYRMSERFPEDPKWENVVKIDRKYAGENALSPSGAGYHSFDVKDAVNGWMQGIYESHGFVFMLDNENKEAVELAGPGDGDPEYTPRLSIEWQTVGDVPRDYALDDTTINLRPVVRSDVSGALQCYGVFADGVSTPDASLSYDLSDTSKGYGKTLQPGNEKLYPNSASFESAFPGGTLRYKANLSNWQTIVPFTEFAYDTLYSMNAKASLDGKTGKTVESDKFLVYTITRYDTMKKIADYYGVPLTQLLSDNKAADMLLVENNTLFVRNPTKNQDKPYQPGDLTDEEKAQIDRSLLGRALHCEYGFEPVNLNTGNFYLSQQDLTLSDSFGDFAVYRSYNSLNPARMGSFGRGFTSFLDESLSKDADGNFLYNREDGSTLTFFRQPDGSFRPEAGYDLFFSMEKTGENRVELSSGETAVPVYRYRIEREDDSTVTFDNTGRLIETAEKNGAVLTLAYDTDGKINSVTREGVTTGIRMNGNGNVERITGPDGGVWSYGYDADQNLASVTDPLGHQKTYSYDAAHRMLSWRDENGTRIVQNTYDSLGRVIKQVDEGGKTNTLAYENGRTTTKDAEGNQTVYTYDGSGRTTGILYADGTGETRTYENGMLKTSTDTAGVTTSFDYNSEGKIIKKSVKGRVSTYEYDGRGNLIKTTDPCKNVTTGVFNGKDLPVKTVDGDGHTESYTYDERGRILSYTDADGLVTSYTYSGGRLAAKTVDGLTVERYGYNALGDIISRTDAEGHVETAGYDSLRRQTGRTDKNGNTESYIYRPDGLLAAFTDGNGNTTWYSYDAYSNITKITGPDGSSQSFTYDALGNQLSKTDAMGNRTVYVYDRRNRLVKETDPQNHTKTYTYDKGGNLIKEEDGEGVLLRAEYDPVTGLPLKEWDALSHETDYTYDSNGNLLTVTFEGELQFTYTYDAAGRRVSETSANGHRQEYRFDARNNVLSIKDQDGNICTKEYNRYCELTKETSATGRTILYTYDQAGNPLTQTDENGNTTTYVCDAAGAITAITDGCGNTTGFAYDRNGNLIKTVNADGSTLQYAYDAANRLAAYKDGNGAVTTYTYDKNGNQTVRRDALLQETSYTYDTLNRILTERDAAGNESSITYDAMGNMEKTTDAEGNVSLFTYDRNRNLLSETDENGNTTKYTYDAFGRMTEKEDAAGAKELYAYDSVGNLIEKTDALLNKSSFSYDKNGNLIKETDALLNSTEYTYNAEQELIKTTDALGNTVSMEYDPKGSLIKAVNGKGAALTYEYDALAHVTKETDALGQETVYTYDSVYNMVQVTEKDGSKTRLAYDNNGNVTKVTDALLNETGYTYDALNRMTASRNAAGEEQHFSYDALSHLVAEEKAEGTLYQYAYDKNGNLVKETDPLSNETAYTYDGAGNVIKKTKPDGSEESYVYDETDRLILFTDGEGNETRYEYDGKGQLVSQTDGEGGCTDLAYDAAGNLTKAADANGNETTYTYDAFGNPVKITDALGNATTLAYDENGNLTEKTYANGGKEHYAYDLEDNLTSFTAMTGLTTRYEYDAMGRVKKEIQNGEREKSYVYDQNGNLTKATDALFHETDYAYDALNRLTKVTTPMGHETTLDYGSLNTVSAITDAAGVEHTYTYDKKGRVTAEAVDLETTKAYTYDALDRLQRIESGEGVMTYRYSSTSQLTQATNALGQSETSSYDARGNLAEKQDALGNTIRYSYDLAGRCRKKTDENGTETNYTYDALNRLIQTESGDAMSDASFTYDEMGNLTAMEDVTGTSTYSYDQAGRLLRYTDGSKAGVSYTYDLYGNITGLTYPDGSHVACSYDKNNRLTEVEAPEGTVSYTYDAEGNVTEAVRENGKTSFTYDENGRVTGVVNTCDGKVISAYGYAYDSFSRIVKEKVRLLADGTEQNQEWSYTYNLEGELLTSQCREGGEVTKTSYTYDRAGNRLLMKTERGEETLLVAYAYDEGGRLIKEEEKTDGILTSEKTCSYDNAGNLVKETTTEKGAVSESTTKTEKNYTYDARGRLNAVSDGENLLLAAVYDGADSRVFAMEYDPKEEAPVQKEPVITAPQEPAEDRNRDTEQPGGDKKNPAGKPAAAAQPDSGRTEGKADAEAAEEDGRGDSDLETEEAENQDQTDGTTAETESRKKNAEEQPQNAFLYGVLTELCSYLPVTTSLKEWLKERVPFYGDCAILKGKRELSRVSFEQISTMDRAQGRDPFEAIKEAVKETGGITIDAEDYRQSSFLNDVTRQNEEVLSSVVCGGTAAEGTYRYTYGLNRESYVYEASTLHAGAAVSESRPSAGSESGSFYYTGTGSVANLISGSDSVSYAYDSFGSCTKSGTYGEVSRDSAAYASAYAYNGEYIHETLGLQYLRARYYDAESGSFISRDSYAGQLDDILSQNRYTYAQNNPLSYADPSGHSLWDKVKSAAKTAANAANDLLNAAKNALKTIGNAITGREQKGHTTAGSTGKNNPLANAVNNRSTLNTSNRSNGRSSGNNTGGGSGRSSGNGKTSASHLPTAGEALVEQQALIEREREEQERAVKKQEWKKNLEYIIRYGGMNALNSYIANLDADTYATYCTTIEDVRRCYAYQYLVNEKQNLMSKNEVEEIIKTYGFWDKYVIVTNGDRQFFVPTSINYMFNGKEMVGMGVNRFGSMGNLTQISNGRPNINVAPRLIDPNYPDEGPIREDEFNKPPEKKYPWAHISVQNTTTGEIQSIDANITNIKAHSFNSYPTSGNEYGTIADYQIQSGWVQTGVRYPNASNPDETAFEHIDTTLIEFRQDTETLTNFLEKEWGQEVRLYEWEIRGVTLIYD